MANELNRINNYLTNDDFFDDLGRSFFSRNITPTHLKTDVMENDKHYQVAIDMPGMNRNDITIDFKDGILSVSAKRDSFSDTADHEGNLIASERSYGRFNRQYRFPNVDRDNISTKYTNGVLTITLPKVSAAISKQKHIQID